MTLSEARMVARELHKLLKEDIKEAIVSHVKMQDDKLISVKEAAKTLGLSTQTIYNNKNKIPHKKIGGRLLFSRNQILELALSPRPFF